MPSAACSRCPCRVRSLLWAGEKCAVSPATLPWQQAALARGPPPCCSAPTSSCTTSAAWPPRQSPTPRRTPALLDHFVRHRDQAPSAPWSPGMAPLARHLCRRALGDPHAAEDAFQATFLVLARRAAPFAGRRAAGSTDGIPAAQSRGAGPGPPGRPATRPGRLRRARTPADALGQLDRPRTARGGSRKVTTARGEPVARDPVLPGGAEPGGSRGPPAGWTPGSVKGRLGAAGKRLHVRLVKRGLTLPAALATVEVARGGAAAGVATGLAAATVRGAMSFAAGPTMAGAGASASQRPWPRPWCAAWRPSS